MNIKEEGLEPVFSRVQHGTQITGNKQIQYIPTTQCRLPVLMRAFFVAKLSNFTQDTQKCFSVNIKWQ